jgi:TonB family protein
VKTIALFIALNVAIAGRALAEDTSQSNDPSAVPEDAVGDDTGIKAPKPLNINRLTMYPSAARRLNQQGRVWMEFSISAQGRATGIKILAAEGARTFQEAVEKYMRDAQFAVPADWDASGGPARRLRWNVLFHLRPCPAGGACEELKPFAEHETVVTITGAPLVYPRH